MRQYGPAYGPVPALVMDDESAEDLVQALHGQAYTDRRRNAQARYLVYSEKYQSLIRDQIDSTHFDEEIKARIYRHIRVTGNLALDICNAVCTVWKHASTSNIHVEGASDSQNEALRALLQESGFYQHARSWNREAFLCGPTTVLPVVRGGRLSWDTLLPHFYAAIDDRTTPWGAPHAAAWEVRPSSMVHDGGMRGYGFDSTAQPTTILVDAASWRYYSESGRGKHDLVGSVSHGVGEFPGATLDFDISHGESRWDARRHQRLVDATVTIGAIEAVLSFVRKSQNKQLLTMIGQLDGVAAGQVQDPERGFAARTANPAAVNIGVIDLDLDPENHIKHQAWIMQTIARSYGGQVESAPGSSSILEAQVSFSHDALTEQRNEQIPFASEFMRELTAKAIMVCRASNHRMSLDLPDPDAVREGLIVKYPPLNRSFASVDEQIKYHDHALSRGLMRFEDLLRPAMPGATDQELTEHIEGNIQAQAPIITMMTTRDQSLAGSEPVPASETEAQRTGRQGPEVRDQED